MGEDKLHDYRACEYDYYKDYLKDINSGKYDDYIIISVFNIGNSIIITYECKLPNSTKKKYSPKEIAEGIRAICKDIDDRSSWEDFIC